MLPALVVGLVRGKVLCVQRLISVLFVVIVGKATAF